jgi:ribonuclease E
MPGMNHLGVSRKIEDDAARAKMREIVSQLNPPKDTGFIVRTAGMDRNKRDLQRDLNYLVRLWKQISAQIKNQPAPAELYQESDLVIRTIRDVFNSEVGRIICDNDATVKKVHDFLSIAMPRTRSKVTLHQEPVPLFTKYHIEEEIEKIRSRHVPLKGGGSLVIDQTEAIVAIDVNSGKYRVHEDAETTAFKINMQAAPEVARQLRLRDLGGVIIIDFIDMVQEKHRREVEKVLRDAVAFDRAKTKLLRISQFGIVEMTRQRMRPSFTFSGYMDCPHCKGSGKVKTPEGMSLEIIRRIQAVMGRENLVALEVEVSPDVAGFLQNRKRAALAELEKTWNKALAINVNYDFPNSAFQFAGRDSRGSVVPLEA